jgi:hypothetical protein
MTLKKAIKEEIERLIDYYEPYRPILDTSEAKKVREVLIELYTFVDCWRPDK